ncbi:MAG: 4a-hydroxytetrahydrobiopterin dehydratase [Candidatus Dormibacteraceae bacterium]
MTEAARRLDDAQVAAALAHLQGWAVADSTLTKSFKFEDFMGAVGFVNQIAPLAEARAHHPDLNVGWGTVGVRLTTHSAGGLTAADFALADDIDQI